MKKSGKEKKSKKSKTTEPELPDLVSAMMRLVERLEALEKKTDLVLGRVSNLPSEMRQAIQNLQRPQSSPHAPAIPRPDQGPRERILYQAVCADCCKRCEVPFKPSGDRPVYCPECFAIRKAGHVPKDLTTHVVVPPHLRVVQAVTSGQSKETVPLKIKKSKKQKPAKKKK